MFIEEILFEFRLGLDKVFSGDYPEVEPLEIISILNNTVSQVIHNRYGVNNIYQKGFEQSQKRTDDLSFLTRSRYFKTDNIDQYSNYSVINVDLLSSYIDNNLLILDKNSRYLHYLKGHLNSSTYKIDSCGNLTFLVEGETFIKIINQEELSKCLYDPFNKPTIDKCLGVFENNLLKLYIPYGLIVKNVQLTFMKYPNVAVFDINNPILNSTNTLNTYTMYEVFSESILFNDKYYKKGDIFETTNIVNFTGIGEVRLFQGIDLPDYFIREIIKETIINYLELIESPRLNTYRNVIQKEE